MMTVAYERRRFVPRWLMWLFGRRVEFHFATWDLSAIYGMPVENLDDAAIDQMNRAYLEGKPFQPHTTTSPDGETRILLKRTLQGEIRYPVGTKPPEWKEPDGLDSGRGMDGGGGVEAADGSDGEGGGGTPPDSGVE